MPPVGNPRGFDLRRIISNFVLARPQNTPPVANLSRIHLLACEELDIIEQADSESSA